MNASRRSQLAMAKEVVQLLTAATAVLAPKVVAQYNNLGINILAIEENDTHRMTQRDTRAYTEKRNGLKLVAAQKAGKLTAALRVLAHDTNDAALLTVAHFTTAQLGKLNEQTCLDTLPTIIAAATTHAAALVDSGITAADMTAATAALAAYRNSDKARSHAIQARAALVAEDALFVEQTQYLAILDDLAVLFPVELRSKYASARNIVDAPTHHTRLIITALDADGNPVPEYEVNINWLGGGGAVTHRDGRNPKTAEARISHSKGEYETTVAQYGECRVTLDAKGFETYETAIQRVKKGDTLRLLAKLVAA